MEITFSPIPDFGEVFSLEDIAGMTRSFFLTNDDGIGSYTKGDQESNVPFIPGDFLKTNTHPEWATGVVWFNK